MGYGMLGCEFRRSARMCAVVPSNVFGAGLSLRRGCSPSRLVDIGARYIRLSV